jgi:hypothetical protein
MEYIKVYTIGGGDLAVANQKVGDSVEAVGGVNHSPARQEQRIHRARA